MPFCFPNTSGRILFLGLLFHCPVFQFCLYCCICLVMKNILLKHTRRRLLFFFCSRLGLLFLLFCKLLEKYLDSAEKFSMQICCCMH